MWGSKTEGASTQSGSLSTESDSLSTESGSAIPETTTETTKEIRGKPTNKPSLNEKERGRTFSPPTHEEVAAYMNELGMRNNQMLEARKFIDHHQARGWILKGGLKVKDWKAACRTWKHNHDEWAKEKEPNRIPVPEYNQF